MNRNSIAQTSALLVAFIAAGTIATAFAQRPGHNPMTLMDRDKNGSVSLKELRDFRSEITDEIFARWDVDGSGELEQEELMSAVREILAKQAKKDDP
ncbi:MAG TPA: EF-hand domain-containing protein [Woeseiaceae bacterium]|nr:EF-hand domain-containing protein [Woeseiaceae bacterium]|tara:strand:- start:135 stop:425 length:291 start_codon:yes stop_codon:yes gene_type:complete